MKILYVALKYDYGSPEQGYSFEHYNFYQSLHRMGHDVLYFDFMTLMKEHGKVRMNRSLLETVKEEKPNLMFTVLFNDELDPAVVKEISENTDTLTLNWFCDDHWRFDNFSRRWAPCFNYAVTTARSALPKYEEIGYKNVIKSQWGSNPFQYRKMELPPKYDVTFVGRPHGDRRGTIQTLREAGIDVRAWGMGWDSGRLSEEEMIRVFNQSKINLNLSNASVYIQNYPVINEAIGSIARSLEVVPFGSGIKTLGARCISAIKLHRAETKIASRTKGICQNNSDQIKGRNFEVPGCGGFTLTGKADNLDEYYDIGKEVVCFEDTNDLVDKVHYYLKNEDERIAIAQAGYERTVREHTYVHRFTEIFRHIGLSAEPVEHILRGDIIPGKTIEVR